MLAAMYGSDEDDGPQEQPIQLRLAGKATIININGQQVAIPRIEYIEAMEAGMRALKAENQQLRSRMRKLELMHQRHEYCEHQSQDTRVDSAPNSTRKMDLR
jgi:hypothetical protein